MFKQLFEMMMMILKVETVPMMLIKIKYHHQSQISNHKQTSSQTHEHASTGSEFERKTCCLCHHDTDHWDKGQEIQI